jgi:arylsulfatase A-like enzyme
VNVLWFIPDALRLDYARKLDFLQHWAKGAVTLEQHFGVAHCSDPNFMSMLTGTFPETHKITTQLEVKDDDGKRIIYPAYNGIQRWLRKHFGHRSLLVGPTLPQIYQDGIDLLIPVGRKDKTTPSMQGIKDFMDETKQMGRPFFAFVRTMDCHQPYYGGAYRRATRFTDSLIKDLFRWVEKHHPDTFIAFLSDHGESLGEHGMKSHLSTLYDVLIHTPCYVKFPGCKAGLKVNEFTRHTDLFPTIAALLGTEEEYSEGRNLEPILSGQVAPGDPHGTMYFVGDGAWREKFWSWRAVRDEFYKYMVSTHWKDGARFYLYDIQSDPREICNLVDDPRYKHLLKQYAKKLCDHFPGWPHPFKEEWESPYSKEEAAIMMTRLHKLGYA